MRYTRDDMYTRRYFRFSLLLPLIVLAVGSSVAGVIIRVPVQLIAGIVVPYMCFSLVFVIWSFGKSPRLIRNVAYRAPIIYLAFEVLYIVLEYAFNVSIAKNAIGLWGILTMASTYIIILGYLYVFLMELGYFSYLYQKRQSRHIRQRVN